MPETCQACGGAIVNPGHGRRYCERCSPPTALGAQQCSHGVIGPCVGCWLLASHKRRIRNTGGRGIRITAADLVAERERVKAERTLLAHSDLDADQLREVRAVLTADHRQSMADIRAELRDD
jgi:hypothetical protein